MKTEKIQELLLLAEQIATEAHYGQFRDDKKTQFIEHPKAVAHFFSPYQWEEKVLAWLHDVLEDTTITEKDLKREGVPEYLINILKILTRKSGEFYLDYIIRIRDNCYSTPKIIKIADLTHNMQDCKNKHQFDKYLLAKYVLEMKGKR